MKLFHLIFLGIFIRGQSIGAHDNTDCQIILSNNSTKNINWSYLKECLITMKSRANVSKSASENIWRLIKVTFDGIENVPPTAYKYMGDSLIFIPLDDLRNISMENVEIIEAFGSIKTKNVQQISKRGFNEKQLQLLAQKIQSDWTGKTPNTYSEYDLKAMGEILCYFNTTDIQNIHADAYKEAAEWIGDIENCPMESLKALAYLATRPEAFGEPHKWSTLIITTIGNVINGLTEEDIKCIDESKLQLNPYYKKSNNNNMKRYQEEKLSQNNKLQQNI